MENKTYKNETLNGAILPVDGLVRLKNCRGTGTWFKGGITHQSPKTELSIERSDLVDVHWEKIITQATKIEKTTITVGHMDQLTAQLCLEVVKSTLKKVKLENIWAKKIIFEGSTLDEVTFKTISGESIVCLLPSTFTSCDFKNVNFDNMKLMFHDSRFINCDFKGTCLDPDAVVPEASEEKLKTYEYEYDTEYVYGYIAEALGYSKPYYTKDKKRITTPLVGMDIYPNLFSVCESNIWHPGIDVAPTIETIKQTHPKTKIYRVKASRKETLSAADKDYRIFRSKSVEVIEELK